MGANQMYSEALIQSGERAVCRGSEMEGSNVSRKPPCLTKGPNVSGVKQELVLTRMSDITLSSWRKSESATYVGGDAASHHDKGDKEREKKIIRKTPMPNL